MYALRSSKGVLFLASNPLPPKSRRVLYFFQFRKVKALSEYPPEDFYGDIPPEDFSFSDPGFDQFDAPPPDPSYSEAPKQRRKQHNPSLDAEALSNDLKMAIRQIVANMDGQPYEELLQMLKNIMGAERALSHLDEDTADIYKSVFEFLLAEISECPSGVLKLSTLPLLPMMEIYAEEVQVEIKAISATTQTPIKPTSIWSGMQEKVARIHTQRQLRSLDGLISAARPSSELMEEFKQLLPPTAKRAEADAANYPRTAEEVDAQQAAIDSARPPMRFSSGYPTVDATFTGPGEPMGFIAPGEQVVFPGGTGTGKSSMSYGLVGGLACDLVEGWKMKDALLVWLHTEEESSVKVTHAGLAAGGRLHHLAKNVIVDMVGTSRARVVEVLYSLTEQAEIKSQDTGRDITEFLPHIVILDYIQSLTGERESMTEATFITAELILRGIQAWDPTEMAKFSGLSYSDFTGGKAWPKNMENHRIATVTFAQLNKIDDRLMFFRKNSKEHLMSDFTMEIEGDGKTAYVDENGNKWAFEVKEGDSRILKQNMITGSGTILKNATAIIFLHRSRSHNNPESKTETGALSGHLEDSRARLIPDKTRNGATAKFIPLSFDLQRLPGGKTRARYFDTMAIRGVELGRLKVHESYRTPGDPMIPIRAVDDHPLAGIMY